MHLGVDLLALVEVGARVGELGLDLRIAKLLEGVAELQVRRALRGQRFDIRVVLAPQVAIDRQEALDQITGVDRFVRRVAGDCRNDTSDFLLSDERAGCSLAGFSALLGAGKSNSFACPSAVIQPRLSPSSSGRVPSRADCFSSCARSSSQ